MNLLLENARNIGLMPAENRTTFYKSLYDKVWQGQNNKGAQAATEAKNLLKEMDHATFVKVALKDAESCNIEL